MKNRKYRKYNILEKVIFYKFFLSKSKIQTAHEKSDEYPDGWEKGGIWDLHAQGKAQSSCKVWEDGKMHWGETMNGNYLKGGHIDCCDEVCDLS